MYQIEPFKQKNKKIFWYVKTCYTQCITRIFISVFSLSFRNPVYRPRGRSRRQLGDREVANSEIGRGAPDGPETRVVFGGCGHDGRVRRAARIDRTRNRRTVLLSKTRLKIM